MWLNTTMHPPDRGDVLAAAPRAFRRRQQHRLQDGHGQVERPATGLLQLAHSHARRLLGARPGSAPLRRPARIAAMPRSSGPVPYVVLLPLKPPGRGKSRLGDLPRDVLAAAFATDTAMACLASPSVEQVLVVTDDASFAGTLAMLGCAAMPDGVSGDLNASLVLAAMEAAATLARTGPGRDVRRPAVPPRRGPRGRTGAEARLAAVRGRRLGRRHDPLHRTPARSSRHVSDIDPQRCTPTRAPGRSRASSPGSVTTSTTSPTSSRPYGWGSDSTPPPRSPALPPTQ